MKKILVLFLLLTFLIPTNCLGQESRGGIEPPGTFKEVINTFKEIGEQIIYAAPRGIVLAWNRVATPFFEFLENKVLPKIEYQINRIIEKVKNWFLAVIKPKLEKEVEERKPVIEKELEKEVEEIGKDTDKVKKSMWSKAKEWVKSLFKDKSEN